MLNLNILMAKGETFRSFRFGLSIKIGVIGEIFHGLRLYDSDQSPLDNVIISVSLQKSN